MRQANDLAAIGFLCGLFDLSAAAFDDENALPLPRQLYGQNDSRSTRADDADISYIIRAGPVAQEIEDHA